MYTRVYRYGCLPPITLAAEVDDQLRLAHCYQNTLIAIERARRAAARSLWSARSEIAELELAASEAKRALIEARQAIKKTRSETRKRSDTKEQRDRAAATLAAKREADRELREARHAARDALEPELRKIDELAGELRNNAREHCGLGSAGPHKGAWGTYLLIEAACDQAFKIPLYDGNAPNDPRFFRYDGCGSIGVQIQKGMTVAELFDGTHDRLRLGAANYITPRPAHAPPGRPMRILRARIGTGDGKAPIFAEWPVIYDKQRHPIPKDATIKWAHLVKRRTADRDRWHVCFTVQTSERANLKPIGQWAVAVDLGWRVIDRQLRVAAWRSEETHGDLRLNEKLIASLRYADTLRSIRDLHFDAARAAVAKFLSIAGDHCSPWIRQNARAVVQWKSPAKLAHLAIGWAKIDVNEAEKAAREALEVWRSGDRLANGRVDPSPEAWHGDVHLWTWEAHQRRRSLNQRKNLYRCFASELASKFGTLVLEKFDLRELARRSDKVENETARSNRQLASVSELRQCLVNAFIARGGMIEYENAVDTTRMCQTCGVVTKVDAAADVMLFCEACQTPWDQDDRAGLNLLARWRKRQRDEKNAGSARQDEKESHVEPVQGSRWARAKSAKAQRERERGSPREEGAKGA